MPGNAVDAVVRLVFRPEFSLSPRTGARTSYTRTWRQVNTELSKERDFGKYVQAAAKEYRKVREAVSGEAGGSVARQLYAYVRDNYAWNGVQAACASGRVADLVRSREGSSADLNLFLAGLLRARGRMPYPYCCGCAAAAAWSGRPLRKMPSMMLLSVLRMRRAYIFSMRRNVLPASASCRRGAPTWRDWSLNPIRRSG